jgi:hypothetical protein
MRVSIWSLVLKQIVVTLRPFGLFGVLSTWYNFLDLLKVVNRCETGLCGLLCNRVKARNYIRTHTFHNIFLFHIFIFCCFLDWRTFEAVKQIFAWCVNVRTSYLTFLRYTRVQVVGCRLSLGTLKFSIWWEINWVLWLWIGTGEYIWTFHHLAVVNECLLIWSVFWKAICIHLFN